MKTIDHETALDALKELDSQWMAFHRKAAELAPRFAAVDNEADLEAALEDLLDLWQEYPLLGMLLDRQAEGKRPPSQTRTPQPSPKEIANKYYSLLDKLKTTETPEEKTDDQRSDA